MIFVKKKKLTKAEEDIVEGMIGSSKKQLLRGQSPSTLSDGEGLKRAYDTNKDVYAHGDTLYVSGTKHADALLDTDPVDIFNNIKANKYQDMIDDLKIPIGKKSETNRYKEAEAELNKNPEIKRIVGHSLGGSVALELAHNSKKR